MQSTATQAAGAPKQAAGQLSVLYAASRLLMHSQHGAQLSKRAAVAWTHTAVAAEGNNLQRCSAADALGAGLSILHVNPLQPSAG